MVRPDGYVEVTVEKGNPHARSRSRVLEHRLVMGEHLGRRLRDDERVHHVNGNRSDNCLENLELWVHAQPAGQRVVDMLAWAREVIERYERESDLLR